MEDGFDIERDTTPCGLLGASQVLVGAGVRVIERATSVEQQLITDELREAGAVVHVARFDFEGEVVSAHRAAAIGVVRRALHSEWCAEEAAAIVLQPSATRASRAARAPWIGELRKAAMRPPCSMRRTPVGLYEEFLDAWLGPSAYERLAVDPPAMDVRVFGPELCPRWFAAGLEWWGAFLYTFRPSEEDATIVALTASATD